MTVLGSTVQGLLARDTAAHIEDLGRLIAQPSVSEGNIGVHECAELLVHLHSKAGFTVSELAVSNGLPGVWAYLDRGKPTTLCVYAMFDTGPVGSGWSRDPYGAATDSYGDFQRVVFGKGARTKGPYMAWLAAIKALVDSGEEIPVNVACLLDGEEFIGSPHYHELVERYAAGVPSPVGAISPTTNQSSDGSVSLSLGAKGCAYFELVSSGASSGRGPITAQVHSSTQAVVHSPAWRLISAMSTLVDQPDGSHVAVAGFYDGAASDISETSKELLRKVSAKRANIDWRTMLPGVAGVGKVASFVDDLDGDELLRRYLYSPTLNINGLRSGYTSHESPLFTLPGTAIARLDMRYAPPQQGKELLRKIRNHLDERGFLDITIHDLGTHDWTIAEPDDVIIAQALELLESRGIPVEVWPMRAAGAPVGVFTEVLGIPSMPGVGIGSSGGAHGVDEYFVLEGNNKVAGFVECAEFFASYICSIPTRPCAAKGGR